MSLFGPLSRSLLLLACMALYVFARDAQAALAVWPLILLCWQGVDDRLPLSWTIELVPFVIAAQIALDSVIPYAGDIAILFGNLALAASLRRPRLPPAILVVERRR
jgi:hypothetical protein